MENLQVLIQVILMLAASGLLMSVVLGITMDVSLASGGERFTENTTATPVSSFVAEDSVQRPSDDADTSLSEGIVVPGNDSIGEADDWTWLIEMIDL